MVPSRTRTSKPKSTSLVGTPAGAFPWKYLEEGPEVWRVEIGKIGWW